MAGDWIPMRTQLAGHPNVLSIASQLAGGQLFGTELRLNVIITLGALHQFWSWAQAATEDGEITGVDVEMIDLIAGVQGFTEAIKKTKWVSLKQGHLKITNFSRWMGNGSKKRLANARRQAMSRQKRDESVTEALPIEQKSKKGVGFEEWWSLYPRKVGKLVAKKAYVGADASAELLLDRVTQFAAAVAEWPKSARCYVPYPSTWLHQGRWADDPATWKREEPDAQRKFRA
ncbi:MAG: hypothetical protein V3S55_09755 [Nitrospiraceae bacterium]